MQIYFNLNVLKFENNMDGHYHKYFSVEIAFYKYDVTM